MHKDCAFQTHKTKAWEAREMQEGFYLLDTIGLKVYLESCLLLEDAVYLATGQMILLEGKQTMDLWMTIFCRLQVEGKETVSLGGGKEDGNLEDQGLCRFAMATKVPQGRGGLNPLHSPK